MKKIILGIILGGLAGVLLSQETVLEKDVENQYTATKGPNMRHHKHFYMGAGMAADFDEEEGTAILPWRSCQFLFGYRYKLKLLSFYAIGLDVNFGYSQYFFEDVEANPFVEGNPLTHVPEMDRHHLANNGIGLEFYHRINIGRRGNTLGNYLDTGIRGQWNMTNAEDLLIRSDDKNQPYMRSHIINRRLNYIQPFSWGLTARIGVKKIVAYGNYRMSDYFRTTINDSVPIAIPELPRLTAGIQVVL